jgi:NADH:ubiquinone oxidoreductase subunit K
MFISLFKLGNVFSIFSVGGYLAALGLLGLVNPARREGHLVHFLLAMELLLLGLATLFVSGAVFWSFSYGQVVALVLLALAGVESAVGLALVLVTSQLYSLIRIDALSLLKA